MKIIKSTVLALFFLSFSVSALAMVDECADFSKVVDKSENLMAAATPPENIAIFHDDLNYFQRNAPGDEYVIYNIAKGQKLIVTAYFWPDEPTVHFEFEISNDNKSFSPISPSIITVPREMGKWHKVLYNVSVLEDAKFIKIIWKNQNDWTPVLGRVEILESNGFWDTTNTKYEHPVGLLKGLNVLEDFKSGTLEVEKPITRGEFTNMVGKLLLLEGTPFSQVFSDTNSGYANALYNLEIINGYDDFTFRPDEVIKTQDAINIIIRVLGYDIYTPYGENSPLTTASILGLTKGISIADTLTRGDSCLLLANSCEVDMVYPVTFGKMEYEIKKGENILTKYHNIQAYDGLITSTKSFSLTGSVVPSKGYFTLGSSTFLSGEVPVENFAGHRVMLYAQEIGGEKTAVYMYSKNTSETKITSNLIDIVKNDRLYFYDEEELKYVNLSPNTRIIRNGSFLGRYGILNEIDITNGYLKLIDNNNDFVCDIVFIYDYEIRRILSDTTLGTLVTGTKDTRLILYGEETPFDGKIIAFKNSLVHILKDGDNSLVEVVVTDHMVEGVIEEFSQNEIVLNNKAYKVSPAFKDDIKLNQNAVLYLDINDLVFSAEYSMPLYGYLLGAEKKNNLSSKVFAKIGFESGVYKIFVTDETIIFNGNREPATVLLNVSPMLITFKYDKDILLSVNGTLERAFAGQDYYRGGNMRLFLGKYIVSEKTKVFIIPTDLNEYSDFYVTNYDFLQADRNYNIEIYDVNEHFEIGALIVYEEGSEIYVLNSYSSVGIISAISRVYDDERVDTKRLSIFTASGTMDLNLSQNAVESSWLNYSGFAVGDVLQYSLDARGSIVAYRVLYTPGYGSFEKNTGDYGFISESSFYGEMYTAEGAVLSKTSEYIFISPTENIVRPIPLKNASIYLFEKSRKKVSVLDSLKIREGDIAFVRTLYAGTMEIMIIR